MRRPLHERPCGRWLLSASAWPVEAADLALKRVVLSTGGVGYFEYEARGRGQRDAGARRAARPGRRRAEKPRRLR